MEKQAFEYFSRLPDGTPAEILDKLRRDSHRIDT